MSDTIEFLTDKDDGDTDSPVGFGRFMFRLSALPDDLSLALPYLDDKSLAVLIGGPLDMISAATIVIDTMSAFPSDIYSAEHQIEVIAAYSPKMLAIVEKPNRKSAPKIETKAVKNITCRLYEPLEGGYEEGRSLSKHVEEGTWQRIKLTCDLDNPTLGIRIDPAEEPCIIDVARVRLRSSADGRRTLWQAQGEGLRQLTVAGTARAVRHDRTLRILSFGTDPQIITPAMESLVAEDTIDVEILMRVSRDLSPVGEVFDELGHFASQDKRIAALEASLSWRVTAPLRKASRMLRR